MKFTGTIYRMENTWVVFIEGEDFRFQEKIEGEGKHCYNSKLAMVFGKKKFSKIVSVLLEYVGKVRKFELTDKMLTVVGLWQHMETKEINESDYDTILWEAKH